MGNKSMWAHRVIILWKLSLGMESPVLEKQVHEVIEDSNADIFSE